MEAVTAYMGAPFALASPVQHGKSIGRTLGTPTINQVFPPYMVVPKKGVYATTCYVGETPYTAVTNVGTRPTVHGDGITCESHLIGYDGSLYGQTVTLLFHAFLREEVQFASLEELKTQIQKDIRKVETLYGIH
jgi:riboflavin kinase/FMN adenylyltransferase